MKSIYYLISSVALAITLVGCADPQNYPGLVANGNNVVTGNGSTETAVATNTRTAQRATPTYSTGVIVYRGGGG